MTVTFFVQTLAKVTQEVVQLLGSGRASNAGSVVKAMYEK